ncbi:CoA transferase [Sinimarinibacterium sp. NLF-5-8]|uniref:CaiB/BaiF CoA-transferase family protein n=1 Tax=Sinimarinibacterium sp. NLF-5-8 TaxID=2698684 RepID=UPI00137BD032|nr:CoA transferase [Sinimarinibacterium sp. NLF-5-8]QHS10284.1 CoA transferase [Sinimarinibacterium sp. NLF-5-8]
MPRLIDHLTSEALAMTTPRYPLAGLTVVELSGHVAGAYCGKLLAGFGAGVVHINGGHDAALDDAARTWLHSAKTQLAAVSAEALHAQLQDADVIIDAWGVGVLAAQGLDDDALRALNPRALICHITPFGRSGPRSTWRADDITLYAASGLMQSTGDGARAPLNARPRVAEVTAGMNAYIALLAALLRGGADTIELAIAEAAMDNYEVALTEVQALGKVARRNNDEHAMVPWRTYPCADGEAAIIGGPMRHWRKGVQVFGAPELQGDAFANMALRIQNRARFEALIQPYLAHKTRAQIFADGQKNGLAWAPMLSVLEALDDPQHQARAFLTAAPGGGVMPDAPFRLQRGLWRSTRAQTVPDIPRAVEANSHTHCNRARAPFAGLRVLDFSHDWAGPHAARLFADYGAQVIKIEYPQRLDGMRGGYPQKINGHPRFWQLHRGKSSLTLDLKNPDHQAVLDHLIKDADVVIENSRAGVMQRKGYGYEHLRALNPKIILLSMSAFGASGPYQDFCGYGGTLEAISGLQSLTAYDAQSRWQRVREMDVMNGIMGTCAAVTALIQRKADGEGQWIDLSENETTAYFIGEFFLSISRARAQPVPIGNRHPQHAPQGCYPCQGEDRWLTLCVQTDAQWQALATLLGARAQDPRFASAAGRQQHHDEIDALITDWLREQSPAAAAQILQNQQIAAAPVMNAADLAQDPHLAARGWWQALDGLTLPGFPFSFASHRAQVHGKGPDLGDANTHWFAAAGVQTLPDLAPAQLGTAYDEK